MSRNIFTPEQQQLLRQNPYVYSVTETRFSLTKEFKELYLEAYRQGESPRRILEDHGFDINLIGERRMAKALKTSNVADNLLQREFESYGPRVVLLTDITYLPYNGRFAYLSTILDAFTKQILSYVLSPSLEIDFVLETVNQLIENHGVSLQTETIIHSDQGCHYTSHKFINILYDKKLRQSMSRKGNCWDNAPQESFFGHMKDIIRPKLEHCEDFQDVKAVVDEYMDVYNNHRYQWNLAKLSPNEYYQFVTTGIYPLDVPNVPVPPVIPKKPSELGRKSPDCF